MHRDGNHEAEELDWCPLCPCCWAVRAAEMTLPCVCTTGGEHRAWGPLLYGFQTGGVTLLLLQGSSDASPRNSICSLQSSGSFADGQWHFQSDSQGVPLRSAGLCCTPGQRVPGLCCTSGQGVPVLHLPPSCVCGQTAAAPIIAATLAKVRSAQGAAGTECAQLPARG